MSPLVPHGLRCAGVTGTNGKTTTTTLLAAALARAHAPVARATTLGTSLVHGDGRDEPLEVAHTLDGFYAALHACAQRGGAFAAVETTSEALAEGFAQRVPCEVAVFTNLTRDHLEAHGTAEHYLASKAQLFVALPPGGVAVLNGRDRAATLLAEIVPAHARVVRYGVTTRGDAIEPLDADGGVPVIDASGTRVEVRLAGSTVTVSTRAIGAHFAENAVAAWLAAEALGVPRDAALAAIAAAAPPPGRFEVVARAPCVVVDYAHTPDALARTLETARALAGRGRLTVVFGAGGERDRGKRPAMGAAASAADQVVLTSDNPRGESSRAIAEAIRAGITPGASVIVELDRRRAIERAIAESGVDDVVVLAGKGHERTQHVGEKIRPFDDAAVAREAIARRARRLGPS